MAEVAGTTLANAAAQCVPFMDDNPRVWLTIIENTLAQIPSLSERSKFRVLFTRLPPKLLSACAELLMVHPYEEGLYDRLKERIISSTEGNKDQRLNELLDTLEIGDSKPSAFFRRMQAKAAGLNLPDEFLINRLTRQLAPEVQQTIILWQKERTDKFLELSYRCSDLRRYVVPVTAAVTNRQRSISCSSSTSRHSINIRKRKYKKGGLPNDLSVYWQQYPWALGVGLCKVRALVSEMMSYTSVLTIVAFSMERYLAICHPLHHYAMSGLKRAVKIIGILWIISFLGAAPFAVYTTVNYLDFPPGSGKKMPESGFCAMLAPNIPPNWPIYEISSLMFFLLPMVVILILYILMGIRIRKRGSGQSLKRLEGSVHETRHSNSRKAIIRMLAAVVIAFFLCWAPFHAQRLLYLHANHFPNFSEINEWMYHIAGIFYYVSSTVNPILYNVMSAKYRLAFKKTLCGFMPARKRSFNNTNRIDHSFIYSSPSKRSRTFSQRNGKEHKADETKTGETDIKSENECRHGNLLTKTFNEKRKTPRNAFVVITPASNKFHS